MAAKRHHASKKHHARRTTAHDRMVDRENLMMTHHDGQGKKPDRMEEVGEESNYMSRRRRYDGTAGMISNDYNAMANLPTEVIMRPYPKPYGYLPEDLGNEYTAADRQIAEDGAQMRRSLAPKKY